MAAPPRWTSSSLWLVATALLSGCAGESVVPPSLEREIDRTLTFSQLKESPHAYKGRHLVLSGEILTAKLLQDGTRLEVLQIPEEHLKKASLDRTTSQGRFMALQREFLDPATVPPGTRVTIVGEVIGSTTLRLDESEYTYPTLEIKNLKVWPRVEMRPHWPYPHYVPYYWGPFWGRWRPYPYCC